MMYLYATCSFRTAPFGGRYGKTDPRRGSKPPRSYSFLPKTRTKVGFYCANGSKLCGFQHEISARGLTAPPLSAHSGTAAAPLPCTLHTIYYIRARANKPRLRLAPDSPREYTSGAGAQISGRPEMDFRLLEKFLPCARKSPPPPGENRGGGQPRKCRAGRKQAQGHAKFQNYGRDKRRFGAKVLSLWATNGAAVRRPSPVTPPGRRPITATAPHARRICNIDKPL